MKKIILISISLIIAGFIVLLTYVKTMLPDVGDAPDIKVVISPQSIARGEYIANSVAVCMDCHSKRDWSQFSGPLVDSTLGSGGEEFNQDFGFPGKFFSKNITPYGIGNWTDGEILRAITAGVNKDGKAIFPVMPHHNYGKLDESDMYDVIAYLRSLKPIKKDVPQSEPDFPMNFIVNTIPTKAEFKPKPSEDDKVAYGKYIFTMASCNDCHTKKENGKDVEGMFMAGGFEFPMPSGGKVVSANLTPDTETGMTMTEEAFVKRFKMYSDSTYVNPKVVKGSFNTVMPWSMYTKMKESDLKALYTYLKTLAPIKNEVVKFTAQ